MMAQTASRRGVPASVPELLLLKQASLTEEKVFRQGVERRVHVVVKNQPFQVQLGLSGKVLGAQVVDYNHMHLEAKLVYDTEAEKEVDFVKVKPFEMKIKVNERGDQANLELRLKVLSSQHEDMLFRVKLFALDPRTGVLLHPQLVLSTEPIKVISKPEQLRKRRPPKKRTLTDMLMESVVRIEKNQAEQQRLIEKLYEQRTAPPDPNGFQPNPDDAWPAEPKDEQSMEEKKAQLADGPSDFEKAFVRFMNSYNGLLPEEKPEKIRKVIRNSSTRDTERLSELIDLCAAEGLQRQIGNEIPESLLMGNAAGACMCAGCPHKAELARIDAFYKDFLSLPTQLLGNDPAPAL